MPESKDPPVSEAELEEAELIQRQFVPLIEEVRLDGGLAIPATRFLGKGESEVRKANGDVWRFGRRADANLVEVTKADGSVTVLDFTPR